jgi:hypothetical protein
MQAIDAKRAAEFRAGEAKRK